jgi:hypothetical protein
MYNIPSTTVPQVIGMLAAGRVEHWLQELPLGICPATWV